MKKLLALLICTNFIISPVFSEITDDFAEKTLGRNLKVKEYKKTDITDTFAEETLNKNVKPAEHKYKPITDGFAEKNRNKNNFSKKTVSYDEIIPEVTTVFKRKVVVIDPDEMTSVPVRIKNNFSTKQKAQEGDYLEFETTKDIVINGKKYPSGTTVNARIENITMNEPLGVPATLTVENFSVDGIHLGGEIHKTGANRTLWVYPCMVSTLWFFGAGALFFPIMGGHAKILKEQIYTLYAEKQ